MISVYAEVVIVHSIWFFGMLPLPFLVSSMGSAGEGGGGGGEGSGSSE